MKIRCCSCSQVPNNPLSHKANPEVIPGARPALGLHCVALKTTHSPSALLRPVPAPLSHQAAISPHIILKCGQRATPRLSPSPPLPPSPSQEPHPAPARFCIQEGAAACPVHPPTSHAGPSRLPSLQGHMPRISNQGVAGCLLPQ